MQDLALTPEQEQQAPIGQVRHYSYNIKQMLSHDDSAILPRSVNHNIKNKYYDSLQDTSGPPPELIAVIRKVDRKERWRGEYNRHYVVNYHLGRQTETNQVRPISCPHQKSVSMRKPKQRPIYPKNRKRDNKDCQTYVKSKEVIPESEKMNKNRPFSKRRISRLFEGIQANSYKLSEKVRDDNNQNDMIKKGTHSRRKGRKHLDNAYNGYLNICISIIMYISVIVKYLVTGACHSKCWRLTATPVLTEMYTLVKIVTRVDVMHEKHNKKYRKNVFNANPAVKLRNNGIYDNFIDVMKRQPLF